MKILSSLRKVVVAGALLVTPGGLFAGVIISVNIAPPMLPVYTQPICPEDGYLWNPGYWAYGPEGYYWIPGVWVRPPRVGVLWTPGYWGWGGGAYLFHAGYWGPHVGFYGGVNYGFGFGGVGYEGGYWNNGRFAYNRSVNNVNVTNVTNVYNKTVVVNNVTNNRASYNGGTGGIQRQASPQEQAAVREQHVQPTAEQQQHFRAAAGDRNQLAKVNGGHPQTAALPRVVARAENQQQRVGNGVKSGQMTAGETRKVEGREASIQRQTARDRAANGGTMTPQERQQVNQRQNNVSRSINDDKHNTVNDKHNGATQPGVQPAARPQPQARPQAAPRQEAPRPEARPQGREGGHEPRR